MKTTLFRICVAFALFNWQCTPDKNANTVTPVLSTFNYDQASTQLMKELAPQLVGKWNLRQVQVKFQKNNYYQNQAKLTKDSTFQNLATLTIVPAAVPRTSPVDTRRGEYDGTITYKGKQYPVQFNLMANPEWLVNKKGPQGYFLFEFRFPDGWHIVEPEEAFLKNVGLVGDNFSLEIVQNQPMVWRGLNRGVERIELVRQ